MWLFCLNFWGPSILLNPPIFLMLHPSAFWFLPLLYTKTLDQVTEWPCYQIQMTRQSPRTWPLCNLCHCWPLPPPRSALCAWILDFTLSFWLCSNCFFDFLIGFLNCVHPLKVAISQDSVLGLPFFLPTISSIYFHGFSRQKLTAPKSVSNLNISLQKFWPVQNTISFLLVI